MLNLQRRNEEHRFLRQPLCHHQLRHRSAFDTVQDTRAGLTVIASSSVPNISATLTLATKDDAIVSESQVTLFQTSSTVINVPGPLNFQKVRFRLNAPGTASAKVNLVQSR